MMTALKGLARYVVHDRPAFVFTLGLALLFAGLVMLEFLSEYLRGAIACLIALLLLFTSALLQKF